VRNRAEHVRHISALLLKVVVNRLRWLVHLRAFQPWNTHPASSLKPGKRAANACRVPASGPVLLVILEFPVYRNQGSILRHRRATVQPCCTRPAKPADFLLVPPLWFERTSSQELRRNSLRSCRPELRPNGNTDATLSSSRFVFQKGERHVGTVKRSRQRDCSAGFLWTKVRHGNRWWKR
jgi:hypothetical protein